ncbi:hypothetical protein, partial [Kitasatospora sp. NPDC085879]|uniref:hypothetical protein n=1 Tax=Kitasatospora sp. NPDC085879 TaxID=3154769 RepID=UPI00344A75C4
MSVSPADQAAISRRVNTRCSGLRSSMGTGLPSSSLLVAVRPLEERQTAHQVAGDPDQRGRGRIAQDRGQASNVQPSRRPSRSRVRHGQASCADYGCTRTACRQAALRARRRREMDRARGLAARVDPAPAALRAAVLVRHAMAA